MLLSEIFNQLTYGEFSQTNLTENDTVAQVDYPRIINYINMGLTELHKRFDLKREAVMIKQYASVFNYILHSDYSVSNTASTQDPKYIEDGGTIFKNNLLLIERVTDELGDELYLNDATFEDTLITTSYNSIQVPTPLDDLTMIVEYRAKQDDVDTTTTDLNSVEIDIPYSHLEALLFYIAARYFRTVPLLNGLNEGTTFYQQFEMSCKQLEVLGLNNTSIQTPNIQCNGWV